MVLHIRPLQNSHIGLWLFETLKEPVVYQINVDKILQLEFLNKTSENCKTERGRDLENTGEYEAGMW